MRIRSTQRNAGNGGEGGGEQLESAEIIPLGALMRRSGMITDAQLADIISRQQQTGSLFGQAAVELGFATDDQILKAVAEQQHFPLFPEGDQRLDPALVVAFDPSDPLADSTRDLRRLITTQRRAENEPIGIIVLLSVDAPSEGGIIVGNLAVSFAQAGYATLLVDANTDQPMQHGLFRTSNRAGVTTMLSRSGPIAGNVLPTALPNLMIMPAGPAVPNAAELFDKVRIMHRLRQLGDQFDIILVDATASKVEEVAVLEGADAATVAVRRHYSATNNFRSMVRQLAAQGVPVLGSVFVE